MKLAEITRGGEDWLPSESVLKATGILREQGRNEEALKILETVNRQKAGSVWKKQIRSEYLATLLALNRKADAIAECGKFLKIEGMPPEEKGEIEKKLKELEGISSQSAQK